MIEARALSKDFADFRAVDSVSLNVPGGEVLVLLGPNGAGKTTIVRMLTSVLAPTEGSARVAGYDVVKNPAEVRGHVGVLTEQHGLYERMRAVEYLDFFGQVYGLSPQVRRQRSLDLMDRFGLTFALKKSLGEYSKGMKQKLALVRAMLHDPPVLLLDEPTSAMDPQSAKLVRDAIVGLQRDQRTFLITTHNLAEAQQLADSIAIIRRGRIIASGDFAELAHQFVGDPLMELHVRGVLNGLAAEIGELARVEEQGGDWLRCRVAQPAETNPALLRRLIGLGVDVISFAPVSQTLEDVYLQAVKEDEAKGGERDEHLR
ncbi:MAG TPA: ABC transporter ATP-binding protein [Candidatus Limnocylindrales bacterium]|nr:ABC transporter ATP-binding protein [Candidatus Limnocylindrales bacterium]